MYLIEYILKVTLLGCPSECKICDNQTSCKSCQDGFFLNQDKCLQCLNACKTCNGPTSNDCESCNSGYFSSLAIPNLCQDSCTIGYYPDIILSTCSRMLL